MSHQGLPSRPPSRALLALALTATPALPAQSGDAAAPAADPAELASWLFAAGSGGPGGNFDWCVPTGSTLIVDTSQTLLFGGPHCDGSQVQNVVGGIIEARNVSIAPGAMVRVLGPNPLVIYASGTVRIEGTIDVSGLSNPGVTTLNTTSIPEFGAGGAAGGGKGGVGSPLITTNSPKGGNGFGAFGTPDGGGAGGETGWNGIAASMIDGRRGAGGGGGSFGANQAQTLGSVAQFGQWDQSFIGLDGEAGFPNLDPGANGALTGLAGPFGGRPGPRPFTDGDPKNDFYGYGIDTATGAGVVGELVIPWAGAGSGAGGNACFSPEGFWPPSVFNPIGDEKGAGGAGGGGSFQILALGDIVFGPAGKILCRGGLGGGGENTLFLNRVGGGSGGGSGGHVILQTAGVIDMTLSLGASTTAGQLAGGILATGGQSGAGKNDKGGAMNQPGGQLQTLPTQDACPPGYPQAGPNGCAGHVDGAGGDGSPGIVQLHTMNGFDPMNPSILLPPGKTIGDVCKPLPVGADGSILLKPRFTEPPGDEAVQSGSGGEWSRLQRILRLDPGEGLFDKTLR